MAGFGKPVRGVRKLETRLSRVAHQELGAYGVDCAAVPSTNELRVPVSIRVRVSSTPNCRQHEAEEPASRSMCREGTDKHAGLGSVLMSTSQDAVTNQNL